MARRQQERAVRTRAVIVRAAAEVFDECGFAGASINKIIRRAGTTMGGIYFHFPSKEALARAVMADQAADLTFAPGPDGLQRLIDITMDVARQLQTNVLLRAGVRLAVEQGAFGMQDGTAYQWWIERFTEQLTAARKQGDLLPHVEEAEVARILVGSYSGTQLLSQILTGRDDLPGQIALLWGLFLPGIAQPEAISRIVLDSAAPRATA